MRRTSTRPDTVGRFLLLATLAAAGALLLVGAPSAARTSDPSLPACSQLGTLGIAKQLNFHAGLAMINCGAARGGSTRGPVNNGKRQVGGGNQDVVTIEGAYPHVVQSEHQIAVNGQTVVVNYNDSSQSASGQYSGMSVSIDGGNSWAKLNPSPLATGHGNNFGDPFLGYDLKLGKWFAGDLVGGCGGQGVGIWSATNPSGPWTAGPCILSSSQGDRESFAIDNTTSSPFFGRMYITYNDFNVGGGALFATYSDDGTTWSAPFQLNPSFIRDVQITVTPNGTVLAFAMNEGGGGLANRQNFVYRSTNGGASWSGQIPQGAAFPAPGDTANGYFVDVTNFGRYMGWGDGVGLANNVAVYTYTAGSGGSDHGDIYYVRSTDNGATWGTPVKIDGDASGGEQWMPSIAGKKNDVEITWYDRRATGLGGYEYWGVFSNDGGLHWSSPQRISDVAIPNVGQPDPNVQADYAGDYGRNAYDGTTFYTAWTDGRVLISGHAQQDVEIERLTTASPGPDYVVQQDGSTQSIVPGTTDVGSHCDDCTASVAFPFTVSLYGVPYTSASVSSNGAIGFDLDSASFANTALPTTSFGAAIFPFWLDLKTSAAGDGIFTTTTGSAPNRTFYIEWRAHTFTGGLAVNFEVAFFENSSTYRVTYGNMNGAVGTVGVQSSPTGAYTQVDTSGGLTAGLRHEYLIPTPASTTGGAHILLLNSDGGGTAPRAAGPGGKQPRTVPNTLRSQLLALPGVASVDVYDGGSSTPSVALLGGYQVVVAFSDFLWSNPAAAGDALADYETNYDGVVVATNFDWFGGGQSLAGRFTTNGFSPFLNGGTTAFSNATLGSFVASNPLLAGVSSLQAFYRMNMPLAAGALRAASWSDGLPLLAYRTVNAVPLASKRTVGINAYLGDFALSYSGDFAKVILNAANWLNPLMDSYPSIDTIMTLQPAFQKDKSFNVGWVGTDPGTGIKNFDVQARTAPYNAPFGAYGPLYTGVTFTTHPYVGTPGSSVCFQVRSTDNAGHTSAFGGGQCTSVPLDDTALTHTGAWATSAVSGVYYGGTASSTTTAGDHLDLAGAVNIKRIGILVTMCPTCGTIDVYYAGVLRGSFNLSTAATSYRNIVSVTLPSQISGALSILATSAGTVQIDGVDLSKS